MSSIHVLYMGLQSHRHCEKQRFCSSQLLGCWWEDGASTLTVGCSSECSLVTSALGCWVRLGPCPSVQAVLVHRSTEQSPELRQPDREHPLCSVCPLHPGSSGTLSLGRGGCTLAMQPLLPVTVSSELGQNLSFHFHSSPFRF